MTSTGLLILSNVLYLKRSLVLIEKYAKKLYIHLNVVHSETTSVPQNFSRTISQIYHDSILSLPSIDIRIIVDNLKQHQKQSGNKSVKNKIDMIFVDGKTDDISCILEKYQLPNKPIYLCDDNITLNMNKDSDITSVYKTVVVGGTFDRIHEGHKILLTEAVLRATNKVIVGVTDENMTLHKKLPELILPIEQRIKDVEDFLTDIDSSLKYQVVPIQDPFGPTKSDPEIDMIIVSDETLSGGEKVNELRAQNGLNQLDIVSINLFDGGKVSAPLETKLSSSNIRINMLGTRIKQRDESLKNEKLPYIIGLTGGIASGKSTLSKKFQSLGGYIIDCDKVAHQIYEPGQICYNKIIKHFGEEIVDQTTLKIDRKKLGNIVFANPKELDALNRIVWPELIIEAKQIIKTVYEQTDHKVFILEAAVLLKAGWEAECNEIWSMIIPPQEAIKRMVNRDKLTEEEAKKRLASQLDNKTIVQKSNVVFSSLWTTEFTEQQAIKAWDMVYNEVYS